MSKLLLSSLRHGQGGWSWTSAARWELNKEGEVIFLHSPFSCRFQAQPSRKGNRAASSSLCMDLKAPLECHKKSWVVVTSMQRWYGCVSGREFSIARGLQFWVDSWAFLFKEMHIPVVFIAAFSTCEPLRIRPKIMLGLFLLFPEQKVQSKFSLCVCVSLIFSLSPPLSVSLSNFDCFLYTSISWQACLLLLATGPVYIGNYNGASVPTVVVKLP